MSTKHTQGPWKVKQSTCHIKKGIFNQLGRKDILTIEGVDLKTDIESYNILRPVATISLIPRRVEEGFKNKFGNEMMSNAKLIAQSPDMYQFIKELHTIIEEQGWYYLDEKEIKFGLANIIKRVEGES